MSGGLPRLGRVQHRIMKVLWERGEATARELTDELSTVEPIAHSTVQTLLRKLEARGAVEHEVRDRTFVFRPVFQKDEVVESAARDLLTRLFDGSIYGLVSHLLKHEKVSPEELDRLRALLEEEQKP